MSKNRDSPLQLTYRFRFYFDAKKKTMFLIKKIFDFITSNFVVQTLLRQDFYPETGKINIISK